MEEDINFAIPSRDRTVSSYRQPRSGKGIGHSSVSTPVIGAALLLGVCLLAVACQSPTTGTPSAHPSVKITTIPLAGADNQEKRSTIRGRVIAAAPGQQIVLYARGQTTWWVQPFADHPFTKIETDSTWSNTTHPGTEYAALLVGPDFRPPSTADVLPTEGVIASAVVRGEIGFWQKWWFPLVCLIAGALVVLGFHRLRLHQISNKLNLRFEERLAERMRIAQELHDTLLQGVLSASMQLHVAVEKLPEDSAARPNLNRSLQLMTQVIEEGRNTLRGLRASTESARDLEAAFSGIPHEFGNHRDIDFRVIVQGQTVPLRAGIRDEIYCIGREALMNALRHSRASHIEVQLEYGVKQLRIIVSDDGCGIDPLFLQTGRDGHWGLSGMRERAKSIGARLRVLSRPDAGTEVELSVPGNIAFVSNPPGGVSKWTARLLPKSKRAVGEFPGEHNQ